MISTSKETICACLTFSLEKCCCPTLSHAACAALSLFSSQPGALCVNVCFLLGRCFPILVTLHHSDREEQIVRGGGRTLRRLECDEVPSLQRSWSFLIWSWGGLVLQVLALPTYVFWGSKKRHLFLQSRSYGPHNFSCT